MQINPGTLYVVATPIGNLGDITERALYVLKGVTRICAEDTRNSKKLLTHFGIQNQLIALHEHNEQSKVEQLTSWLLAGDSLALISDAGTPLISDPGYHLVQHLQAKGIPVVPVPGVSAIITALSVAGLPTDRFVFEGFLPSRSGPRKEVYLEKTKQTCTQVYYESSHRILASVKDLAESVEPERKIVIARELTKLYEQIFAGSVNEALGWLQNDSNHQKGEFVLLVQGAFHADAAEGVALEPLLAILMEEVSVKQAAKLASRITKQPKNHCYKMALKLDVES